MPHVVLAHLAVTCVVGNIRLVVVVVVMVMRSGEVDERDVDALTIVDFDQPRAVWTSASRLHGDDAGEQAA